MSEPVYPEAKSVTAVQALDENICATRIIEQRALRKSKAQAAGVVLAGSNDVKTYDKVWDEIEAERKKLRAISPADHTTETKFKEALTVEANHLDVNTWVAGLKDEADVSTWSALKADATPQEIK